MKLSQVKTKIAEQKKICEYNKRQTSKCKNFSTMKINNNNLHMIPENKIVNLLSMEEKEIIPKMKNHSSFNTGLSAWFTYLDQNCH